MIGILARPAVGPARAEARPDRPTLPCVVEIENTADSLHAHVEIDGLQVGPGDTVTVYGAPTHVPFGHKGIYHCRAVIDRAGPLGRAWTRFTAYFGLTELYEVSFSGGRIQ